MQVNMLIKTQLKKFSRTEIQNSLKGIGRTCMYTNNIIYLQEGLMASGITYDVVSNIPKVISLFDSDSVASILKIYKNIEYILVIRHMCFIKVLTLTGQKMKIIEFANSTDLDEVAQYEPPHLNLYCLLSNLLVLDMIYKYFWTTHYLKFLQT